MYLLGVRGCMSGWAAGRHRRVVTMAWMGVVRQSWAGTSVRVVGVLINRVPVRKKSSWWASLH